MKKIKKYVRDIDDLAHRCEKALASILTGIASLQFFQYELSQKITELKKAIEETEKDK